MSIPLCSGTWKLSTTFPIFILLLLFLSIIIFFINLMTSYYKLKSLNILYHIICIISYIHIYLFWSGSAINVKTFSLLTIKIIDVIYWLCVTLPYVTLISLWYNRICDNFKLTILNISMKHRFIFLFIFITLIIINYILLIIFEFHTDICLEKIKW